MEEGSKEQCSQSASPVRLEVQAGRPERFWGVGLFHVDLAGLDVHLPAICRPAWPSANANKEEDEESKGSEGDPEDESMESCKRCNAPVNIYPWGFSQRPGGSIEEGIYGSQVIPPNCV